MASILNSAILHKKTSLIHSESTSWWQPYWILASWIQPFCTKKTSLIHSNSTWWWQSSWILPSWIYPSWIQPSWIFLSNSLTLAKIGSQNLHKKLHSFILTQLEDCSYFETCHPQFSHFAQKELYSFILNQLSDGSHLEFCHVGFRHCHLGFRHLVIFSQIHSKTLSLPSDSESN